VLYAIIIWGEWAAVQRDANHGTAWRPSNGAGQITGSLITVDVPWGGAQYYVDSARARLHIVVRLVSKSYTGGRKLWNVHRGSMNRFAFRRFA
jgi:hypothetical protein